jgi:Flp pilus assembly protein TadG
MTRSPTGDAPPRSAPRKGESGAVTAEAAVALPILLLVTWIVVAVLMVGSAQLACQDAARAAARAASRGEPALVVGETARRAAPAGAEVSVQTDAGLVVVEVIARVRVAGPWGMPAVRIAGRAVAQPEADSGGAS